MPDRAVECYSGHTYAQEPRAVVCQGRRHPVSLIERRWRTPEGPGFWVQTGSAGRFELQYFELEDRWSVRVLASEGDEIHHLPISPDLDKIRNKDKEVHS